MDREHAVAAKFPTHRPGGVFHRDLVEGPLDQFGIDCEGPWQDCKNGESDLIVPERNVSLPPNILQQLQQSIDPLAASELFGLDIYVQCLHWLQSTTNSQ